MKNFKRVAIGVVVIYAAFCLITKDFNPMDWQETPSVVHVIVQMGFIAVMDVIFKIEKIQ